MTLDNKGMVQVYTGDGKGKTTAALGLALRAWGHDKRVLIIQLMKGRMDYGEVVAAKRISGIDVEQFGRVTFVNPRNPSPEDKAVARLGLARAREALAAGDHDVVILDEVNVACFFGLVDCADVLDLIRRKPAGPELILTGRGAPAEVMEAADLVTEMREIKHYYGAGVKARKGIEY